MLHCLCAAGRGSIVRCDLHRRRKRCVRLVYRTQGLRLSVGVLQDRQFLLADEKRFYATIGSDIYGGWRFDYAKSRPELDPPIPVDDALCHRLDKLEDIVAAEWLIFGDDERFEADKAAYAADDLPAGEVLVHHDKLAKFDRDKPVWTFYSHGFSDEVLNYMTPRWPLDYGAE